MPAETKSLISNIIQQGGLRNSLHGNLYQLALLVLVAQRAHKKGFDFSLGSESDEFEKFDDLVFEEPNRLTFLQAKHSSQRQPYTLEDLSADPNGHNKDISLAKYFDSWWRLKHNPRFQSKKSRFIFFSNRPLESRLSHIVQEIQLPDDLFSLPDGGGKTVRIRTDNNALKEMADLKKSIKKHAKAPYEEMLYLKLDVDPKDHIQTCVTSLETAFKEQNQNIKFNKATMLALSTLDLDPKELSNHAVDEEPHFKFSQAFIDGIGLKPIPMQLRTQLFNQIKDEKKLKQWLESTKITTTKDFLKMNSKVTELEYNSSEKKIVFKGKDGTKNEVQSTVELPNDNTVILIPRNKEDQLFIIARLGERPDGNIQLSKIPATERTFIGKKFLSQLTAIIKTQTLSTPVTDETIHSFFSEFIFKVAQPDTLAPVIQAELCLNQTMSGDQLYQDLFQHILNWFAKSKTNALEKSSIASCIRVSEADLNRFYLLGETQQYQENCLSENIFPINQKVINFLSPKNKRSLLIFLGQKKSAKKQSVYESIRQVKLKDSSWAFLTTRSKNFQALAKFLGGKQLMVVIIDAGQTLAEEEQAILAGAIASSSTTKIIVLLGTIEDEVFPDALKVGLPSLTHEDIKKALQPHLDKRIWLGSKTYAPNTLLEDNTAGIYQALTQPDYLVDIIQSADSENPKEENEPIFIPQTITLKTPIYTLSTMLDYAISKGRTVVFSEGSPQDLAFSEMERKTITELSKLDSVKLESSCANIDPEKILFIHADKSPEEELKSTLMKLKGKKIWLWTIDEPLALEHILPLIWSNADQNEVQINYKLGMGVFPPPSSTKFIEEQNVPVDVLIENTERSFGPVIVLDSDAGFGKSANLTQLAQKHASSKLWVIRINLPDINIGINSLELFIKAHYKEYEQEAIFYDLERGKVILLLDSWDEVKENKLEHISEFIVSIMSLRKTIQIKILIASRPHQVATLPITAHHFACLNSFAEAQVQQFMQGYYKQTKSLPKAEAQAFAESLASHFFQNKFVSEALAIPLHIHLFTEAMSDSYDNWKSQSTFDQLGLLTKTQLYQMFTFSKLKIYLEKHLQVRQEAKINIQKYCYSLCASYLKMICQEAFEQLFLGGSSQENFPPEAFELGFISTSTRESKQVVSFLHATYTEYFAAVYILKKLASNELATRAKARSIIEQHRFDPRYVNVWTFMLEITNQGNEAILTQPICDRTTLENLFFNTLPDLVGTGEKRLKAQLGLIESDEKGLVIPRTSFQEPEEKMEIEPSRGQLATALHPVLSAQEAEVIFRHASENASKHNFRKVAQAILALPNIIDKTNNKTTQQVLGVLEKHQNSWYYVIQAATAKTAKRIGLSGKTTPEEQKTIIIFLKNIFQRSLKQYNQSPQSAKKNSGWFQPMIRSISALYKLKAEVSDKKYLRWLIVIATDYYEGRPYSGYTWMAKKAWKRIKEFIPNDISTIDLCFETIRNKVHIMIQRELFLTIANAVGNHQDYIVNKYSELLTHAKQDLPLTIETLHALSHLTKKDTNSTNKFKDLLQNRIMKLKLTLLQQIKARQQIPSSGVFPSLPPYIQPTQILKLLVEYNALTSSDIDDIFSLDNAVQQRVPAQVIPMISLLENQLNNAVVKYFRAHLKTSGSEKILWKLMNKPLSGTTRILGLEMTLGYLNAYEKDQDTLTTLLQQDHCAYWLLKHGWEDFKNTSTPLGLTVIFKLANHLSLPLLRCTEDNGFIILVDEKLKLSSGPMGHDQESFVLDYFKTLRETPNALPISPPIITNISNRPVQTTEPKTVVNCSSQTLKRTISDERFFSRKKTHTLAMEESPRDNSGIMFGSSR